MTNEERIRLVLETLGADNVRQATRAIREMAESVDSLEGELAQLEKSIKEGVEAPMERFLVTLKDGRKVWNDSAEGLKHLGKTVSREGDFGRNMLTASYFVDDLQYGLRGIVNNVPQMVQAFGGGAAAAGAIGIAFVGINQAVSLLGPLFEDTSKPVKKFSDAIGDFAKSSEIGKYNAEAMGQQVKKLAESFSPGLLESVDATLERMDKLVEKQQKVIEQNEKIRQQQADIAKTEKQMADAAKDERGGLAEEYFQGAGAAGQKATVDALSPEFRDQAKRDIVQQRLSMLESTGAIKTEWQREFARTDIERNLKPEDIAGRTRELAMAAIGAAQGGDRAGIERLARMDPNFAAFMESDAADKAFDQSLRDRSSARASRDEIRAKRSFEQASNPQIPDEILAQRQRAMADFAAGEKAAAGVGPDRGMLEQAEIDRKARELAEAEAKEKARREIMAGLSEVLPDPSTLAAMRRVNAGTAPGASRRMGDLERMDIDSLTDILMQRGMSRHDARATAGEYLGGGNEEFNELAKANGMNARNVNEGFRAAIQLMQMIQQDQQETQQMVQWLQQQAAMTVNQQPNMRPQMGRARP